ncbi:MAG: hypothetical protein GXP54_04580 [Deltaproteobacteria bacterium]|nr:hypothetical protein [Deltaproteobacteria bacterium]
MDYPGQRTDDSRGIGRMYSLGWRMGVSTALAVTMVLGILTFIQLRQEILRSREEMVALLDEAMVPLLAELESAPSFAAAQKRLDRFQRIYKRQGMPRLHFRLQGSEERNIGPSFPGDQASSKLNTLARSTLHGTLPLFSPIFPNGSGTLSVWLDDPSYGREIVRRWQSWGVDLLVTILSVLAVLLLAHHVLVTRPLKRLMDGVQQMEHGYLDALKSTGGAREWRALASGIRHLGAELEHTVRSLVEAERRALMVPPGIKPVTAGQGREEGNTDPARPTETGEDGSQGQGDRVREIKHHLRTKCRLIETQNPDDPLVRMYAKEAWEMDVVEAERMGEIHLRNRLDDAAFWVLHPDEAEEVRRYVASITKSPMQWVLDREARIRQVLRDHDVPLMELQRRTKHLAGIWRKAQVLGLPVDQVQDVFGFRVIVPEEEDCYRALDAIHRSFQAQFLSFKDYIAHPKKNGYQSIHTHLLETDGLKYEVQIRSRAMHERTEQGPVSHWQYRKRRLAGSNRSKRWHG